MLPQNIIFALASAGLISAVPLNINLGAYSPALVVGDGEISFGGAENAGQLMETLASGAATSAQRQGAAEGAAGAAEGQAQPAGGAQAQAQATPPGITQAPNPASAGETAKVITPEAQANDILPEGAKAQAVGGETENNDVVGGMISKGMEPSLKIPSSGLLPHPNMEKRSAPSLEVREPELAAEVERIIKREINGFNAALNYAISAMKNQPEVELGTGGEGSGVGIIVNPGVSVPAGSPAAGERPPSEARPAAAGKAKRYVMPGAPMGASAEQPKSGITLMAIAEI